MAQTRTKSVVPPAQVEGLRGSLAQTNLLDLLQFLNASRKTGQLVLEGPEGKDGRAYYSAGNLVHVTADDLGGMDALMEVVAWEDGTFRFHDDVLSPKVTIKMSLQHALMEAMRLHDEQGREDKESAQSRQERSDDMQTRSSTDVLEDFLKIPDVNSAVVVGRDGFLIESAGGSSSVVIDNLGASLAHAVNGIEEMGQELEVNQFQDLFVEYGRSIIICKPVGDAVLAVVAPDASKLGIIRHKIKPLVTELAEFF